MLILKFRNYIILVLAIIPSAIWSQKYEYVSFPDSNCIWSEKYTAPIYPDTPSTGKYYIYALFNDDTIINSLRYHKLYILYDSIIDKDRAIYIGALREDNTRKIYYKGDHIFFPIENEILNENDELLLYDFSVDIGDTIYVAKFASADEFLVVSDIDTMELNHGVRRVIHFENFIRIRWIEGIGNVRGLLSYSGSYPTNGMHNDLICFKKNDTLIYFNSDYDDCFTFVSSIPDYKKDDIPRVFPNPVDGISFLKLARLFDMLEIYQYDGTKIIVSDITDLKYYEINSSQFTPGLYIYNVFSNKGLCRSGKFIVY